MARIVSRPLPPIRRSTLWICRPSRLWISRAKAIMLAISRILHHIRGDHRDGPGTVAVRPDQGREGVREGREEDPQGMILKPSARKRRHEPWRVGERAELHHHEGDREHDPDEPQHPRANGGEERQCGGDRHSVPPSWQESLLEPRQDVAGDEGRRDIPHRDQPRGHQSPRHVAPSSGRMPSSAPVSMICTPTQSRRKAESRVTACVPSCPNRRAMLPALR